MVPMTMNNHYVIDYVRAKGARTNETPPVGPGKHSENTTMEALARSMAVDKEGKIDKKDNKEPFLTILGNCPKSLKVATVNSI